MANVKISELTLVTPASADEIVIVDSTDNASKKITVGSLPDTNTTYTAGTNVAISGSNVISSTDTNTTYSVGDGGLTTNDFTNADHSKLNAIEASATADQSASDIKTLLEDGIDSVHYVDGSIDLVHLSADSVDGTKLADDAVDSEHYTDGSIDTAHIGANQVTAAKVAADVATQAELDTVSTVASAALPKAGGAMTGAITTNSTFDGVDIATRDGVLTSTTTTAGAALPKAGGAMTGAITTNSTFDGVDIATRDGVLTSTTTTADAALPKAGGTMTGTTTLLGITETEAGTANATYTIDLSLGTLFEVTHASLCTVTMPTAAAGKAFTVIATVPAAWSGTILWSGGSAPTGGSGKTIYSFVSNGTSWYGMRAGTGFA